MGIFQGEEFIKSIIKPIETDKDFSDDESVYMPSYAATKQKTSYDIVGEAVSEYWRETLFPCDVIAFFYQKYEYEKNWEWREELVESHSDRDYESMTFLNDFCEGQTCVKDITIVPLWKVTEYYTQHVLMGSRIKYE